MADNGGNHSWNGGNGFEEDGTVENFVLSDFSAVPSGGFVIKVEGQCCL